MAQTLINNALQEWNDEIKKAFATLTPDEGGACYIMSLTRRKQGIVGGTVSKVAPETAALHIAGETHREATEEEVITWNAQQAAKRQAILSESAKRETKFALDLGPLAEALVALGQRGLQVPSVTSNQEPAPAVVTDIKAAVEGSSAKVGGKRPTPVQPPVNTTANTTGEDRF